MQSSSEICSQAAQLIWAASLPYCIGCCTGTTCQNIRALSKCSRPRIFPPFSWEKSKTFFLIYIFLNIVTSNNLTRFRNTTYFLRLHISNFLCMVLFHAILHNIDNIVTRNKKVFLFVHGSIPCLLTDETEFKFFATAVPTLWVCAN